MSDLVIPALLRKTTLNAVHRLHKAKMVDFGGWDMPVRGPNSLAAVQKLLMNDASKLQIGQAHYSAMLYEDGTFVDDVVLHKLSDNDYLIVINAGTRTKDVQWVRKQIGHM